MWTWDFQSSGCLESSRYRKALQCGRPLLSGCARNCRKLSRRLARWRRAVRKRSACLHLEHKFGFCLRTRWKVMRACMNLEHSSLAMCQKIFKRQNLQKSGRYERLQNVSRSILHTIFGTVKTEASYWDKSLENFFVRYRNRNSQCGQKEMKSTHIIMVSCQETLWSVRMKWHIFCVQATWWHYAC